MKRRGFTLIELLVALFITAIIFSMGYSALSQALINRRQVDEQAARLSNVQQALRIMEQDFELLQPRPVRDLSGSGYQNPLVLNQSLFAGTSASGNGAASGSAAQQGLAYISFTRGGWANPAGLPRGELQRVSYLIRDGKLIRQHLPELDTTGAVPVEERELLDQVEALNFSFMDDGLTWQARWPTPIIGQSPPQDLLRSRPVAVEITLKLSDWGTLVRKIEVAG